MIQIKQSVIDGIVAHAFKDSPIEACGYLAGQGETIEAFFPLTNTDASPEHFSLDPKEQFACVRAIRTRGLALRAVYHSHPATPARMSQEDIHLAYDPNLSYVIVSLATGSAITKSFRVTKGSVAEEPITKLND